MTPYNKETIAEVISELQKLPNPNLAAVIQEHIQALEEKLRIIYNQCECIEFCDCSTGMKRIAGEALSKIQCDAQPAQYKEHLKWKPY